MNDMTHHSINIEEELSSNLAKHIQERINDGILSVMSVVLAETPEQQMIILRKILKDHPSFIDSVMKVAPFPKEAQDVIDMDDL